MGRNNTEEKYHYDFRYVEFIRNPQLKKTHVDQSSWKPDAKNIICIALDYFDVIYVKKVHNLRECMVSENDIPCEAYQSLGLFRKEKENSKESQENDPFKVDQKYPFFAIMQVTVTPEAYQENDGGSFDVEQLEGELHELVVKVRRHFEENHQIGELRLKHKIYHTVNTMDFCIVLSSERMDFAAYLSTEIKAITCGPTEEANPKYAVYTVMGIYNRFQIEKDRTYTGRDTILVARIRLSRGLYVDKNLLHEFREALRKENAAEKGCVSTHSLPGRYELSVRIDGAENILSILEMTLKYIMCSFTGEGEETAAGIKDHSTQSDEKTNVLKWLMENRSAKYLNLRIFFNTLDCFEMESEQGILLKEHTRLPDPEVEKTYENLHLCACQNGVLEKLDAYFDKLHHMIHTYVTLIPQYDTNINIKMLGECLIDFMKLLMLHIQFVSEGLENIEEVGKNTLWALNYFQQYVRVISSVNSSSFQSPQYEIEKDECSIVKLPIAYMQFLQEMFDKYYKLRESRSSEEKEFDCFPRYIPLVIPYMQNNSHDSDFMMLTLLGQNMTDNWDAVKGGWSDHIKESRTLMFIICQDMKKYKSASELIVSSFHEMGHYCNGLTREERNMDLIEVLSEKIARSIAKRAVANSKVSYQQMVMAFEMSREIECLYECIYLGVVHYFQQELGGFIQFPQTVFLEKMWKSFHDLTNEFADFENPAIFHEQFFDDQFDKVAFAFGYRCKGKCLEEKWADAENYLRRRWEETIGKVNDCLTEIEDRELSDKTGRYVESNCKLMETVRPRESDHDGLCKGAEDAGADEEQIRGVKKSLKENANELAEYIRTYRKADIETLRNSLRENQQLTTFYLQFIEDSASHDAAVENRQWVSNSDMKALAEKRGKLLEKIEEYYRIRRPLSMADAPITLLELLRKMHITEEDSPDKFKIYLNQAVSGLSVSEAALELAKSNYEESIADIAMCANLNLGVKEYLAFIFDMYETADNRFLQSVPRFAVVIAYLIYIKNMDEHEEALRTCEDGETLQKLLERARRCLMEDFQSQMEELRDRAKEPFTEICKGLQRELIDVQKSKLFRVAFCRAFQLRNKLKFIEKSKEFEKNQDFVRKSLEIKLYDGRNGDVSIQNDEMDFILHYYYKNRVQYANKKEQSTKEGFSDGVEPGV